MGRGEKGLLLNNYIVAMFLIIAVSLIIVPSIYPNEQQSFNKEAKSSGKTVIVCYGDSITEGNTERDNNQDSIPGIDSEECQYEYYLFKNLNNNLAPTVTRILQGNNFWISRLEHPDGQFVIYNCGNGGTTTDALLSDIYFDYQLESLNPDYVILLVGINDLGTGGNKTDVYVKNNLTLLYNKIDALGIKLVSGTLLPVNTFTDSDLTRTKYIKRVNTWIRNQGYSYIDFWKIMNDPSHSGHFRSSDSSDGTHPNATGYNRMGSNIDTTLFIPPR